MIRIQMIQTATSRRSSQQHQRRKLTAKWMKKAERQEETEIRATALLQEKR